VCKPLLKKVLYMHIVYIQDYEYVNELDKPNAWGYNWTTMFLGEINTSPGWGSLKMETVKYDNEFHGTQAQERLRCRGPAATVNYRPEPVRYGAPHQQTHNCLKIKKGEKLVSSPRWAPDTKSDWPTNRRS
jgi:hypothetical protein